MKTLKILLGFFMAIAVGLVLSTITGAVSETVINPGYFVAPLMGFNVMGVLGVIKMPAGALFFNLTNMVAGDVTPDDVEENMGGYSNTAYIALLPWITTHPRLPNVDTATTPEELVTLLGTYVMESGKYFMKVTLPPKRQQSQPESQGEDGSKSFNPKGNVFVPGTSDENTMGLMRILNNAQGIVIMVNHKGKRIQFGDELHPVTFMPKGDSGVAPADANGFTLEFTTDSFAPGYKYNSTIILDSGTLDPVS